MTNTQKEKWNTYKEKELQNVQPVLTNLGYIIDDTQVHIDGERYLMAGAQDIGGGGKKLVLIGTRKNDGQRVVIKCSSDKAGACEIAHERKSRKVMEKVKFAYKTLLSPKELLFTKKDGFTIFITEYIVEDKPFLKSTLSEQFFLALGGFKMQEGVHATAHSHTKHIEKMFGLWSAKDYVASIDGFIEDIKNNLPNNQELLQTLEEAKRFFLEHAETVDRYSDFLTHADFVPHNLRIRNNAVYLLDFASVHFGNKYESWARFLNYMVLYNPELKKALLTYVKDNRGREEYLALRLMRIYKLIFLLRYYATSITKTSGDLHTLTLERVRFWTEILRSILNDREIPEELIHEFKLKRDSLRSPEEKLRQKELNQLV